jgi:hypothetical protein
LLFVLLVAVPACGESSHEAVPVLPSSAVPGLAATTRVVDAEDLAADFGGSGVTVNGVSGASERVFQGHASGLDQVVSRTVEFEDAGAAQEYLNAFRTHLSDVFGAGTAARNASSRGREGFVVDAASCACHRAQPTYAAIVRGGRRVSYLEINGSGADEKTLRALLDRTP